MAWGLRHRPHPRLASRAGGRCALGRGDGQGKGQTWRPARARPGGTGRGVGAHFGLGAPLQHVQELSAEAFQLREADPGGGGNERQPGLAGDRGRHGVRVSWGQAHTRPLEEEDPAARVTELGQGSLWLGRAKPGKGCQAGRAHLALSARAPESMQGVSGVL